MYDDWNKESACRDCYALPCKCSVLTRLLERLSWWLIDVVNARYRRRSQELYNLTHPK